jgi:hypothetical protein
LIKPVIVAILTLILVWAGFVGPSLPQNANGQASHLQGEKFAVLNHVTELHGIVAAGTNRTAAANGDLYVTPDLNYRNLLLPGNTNVPNTGGPLINGDFALYPGWKSLQDTLAACNLNPAEYPKPYPILKLELYGFHGYNRNPDGPQPNATGPSVIPTVIEHFPTRSNPNGLFPRPLHLCDHIVVTGVWVIDAGHTMYGPYPCSFPRNVNLVCPPTHFSSSIGPAQTAVMHAELHPYNWKSVQLLPGPDCNREYCQDPNGGPMSTVERHVIVVPYYYQVFQDKTFNKDHGYTGPTDNSRIDQNTTDWYIKAPLYPAQCKNSTLNPGGCGCCTFSNTTILKMGKIDIQTSNPSCIPNCSPGEAPLELHVHVTATSPTPKTTCITVFCWTDYSKSDWIAEGGSAGCEKEENGCLGVYEIGHPSIYDAQFTAGWIKSFPCPVGVRNCTNPP